MNGVIDSLPKWIANLQVLRRLPALDSVLRQASVQVFSEGLVLARVADKARMKFGVHRPRSDNLSELSGLLQDRSDSGVCQIDRLQKFYIVERTRIDFALLEEDVSR